MEIAGRRSLKQDCIRSEVGRHQDGRALNRGLSVKTATLPTEKARQPSHSRQEDSVPAASRPGEGYQQRDTSRCRPNRARLRVWRGPRGPRIVWPPPLRLTYDVRATRTCRRSSTKTQDAAKRPPHLTNGSRPHRPCEMAER